MVERDGSYNIQEELVKLINRHTILDANLLLIDDLISTESFQEGSENTKIAIEERGKEILQELPDTVGGLVLPGTVVTREVDLPEDDAPDIWGLKEVKEYKKQLKKTITNLLHIFKGK